LNRMLVNLRSVWVIPLLWQCVSNARSCQMIEAAEASSKYLWD
jgi:hypothetical protein